MSVPPRGPAPHDGDVALRRRGDTSQGNAVSFLVERRAAPYAARMLRRLAHQGEGTAYLEDGSDPGW